MSSRGACSRSARKLLATMVVVLTLAPALASQPASAQPVQVLHYLCVHRVNGLARVAQSPSDCTRYEVLIDLEEDAPLAACADRVTHVIAIRDNCTRYEQSVVLGGEEAVDVCISLVTGQLRYAPSGSCGRGEMGAGMPVSFSAACVTSGDCPQHISEFYGFGTVTHTLTVAGITGTITDVNVMVDLVAEDLEDVDLSLTSPGGTTVMLYEGSSCLSGLEELQVVFDDEGSPLACEGLIGFNAFQPAQPLSDFDGEDASGDWTLTVSVAGAVPGAGVLFNWSLAVTTTAGGTEVACTACMVTFPDDSTDPSAGGTLSTLQVDVPPSATIADLDVRIDIAHTWLSDLHIFVVSPSGTSVRLFDQACEARINLEVIYDDEASGGLDCAAWLGFNRFQPVGSLAAFDGEPAAGSWHLVVLDDAGFDAGTLNNWVLDFTLN